MMSYSRQGLVQFVPKYTFLCLPCYIFHFSETEQYQWAALQLTVVLLLGKITAHMSFLEMKHYMKNECKLCSIIELIALVYRPALCSALHIHFCKSMGILARRGLTIMLYLQYLVGLPMVAAVKSTPHHTSRDQR